MKIQRLFLVLIAVFLIIITGCSNGIENEEQLIVVDKRLGNENNFEEFRKVTNSKHVLKVKEILNENDWESVKVDMVHPPDYRFIFQYKNPEIEAKAVGYELWISPNKDRVELVKDALSEYSQLNAGDSEVLFEILTGEKLSE